MAAGLSALISDVKWGSGAFMVSLEQAEELATSLVSVSIDSGLPAVALISDMNEVLGHSAGNAVEMDESVEFLTGHYRDKRLEDLSVALVAEMLLSVELVSDLGEGERKAKEQLESGAAAEKFGQMVAALGGPTDFIENHRKYLDISSVAIEARPARSGYISHIDVRRVGNAVIKLGGGRIHPDAGVHHAVGLTNIKGVGQEVSPTDSLCQVHTDDNALAELIAAEISGAVTISDTAPYASPIISKRIDG